MVLDQGTMPDVITYIALISASKQGQKTERSSSSRHAILDLGLVPNVITYSALISACAEGDREARALELVQLMRAQGPGAQRHPLQLLD